METVSCTDVYKIIDTRFLMNLVDVYIECSLVAPRHVLASLQNLMSAK